MEVITLLVGYMIFVNLIGFGMMGIDKHRAIKHAWRISEGSFFVVAFIGGSIGTIAGMHIFRHKTRHWYFVYGMPAILVVQVILFILAVTAPVTYILN